MPPSATSTFLVGGVSGACAATLLQPFDVLKTRAITYAANTVASRSTPFSWVSVARHIYTTQGVPGFWRGTFATINHVLPTAGVYFLCMNVLADGMRSWKRHRMEAIEQRSPREQGWNSDSIASFSSRLSRPSERYQKLEQRMVILSPLEMLYVGILGRSLSATMTSPLLLIKTRVENSSHGSWLEAYRSVTKKGYRSLFSGVVPTVIRDGPFSGIYMLVYTFLKPLFDVESSIASGRTKEQGFLQITEVSFLKTAMAGFSAGSIASILTQPADVLRTRVQTVGLDASNVRWNTLDYLMLARRIWRTEGAKGLFIGSVPRLLKRAGGTAITWALFESFMK